MWLAEGDGDGEVERLGLGLVLVEADDEGEELVEGLVLGLLDVVGLVLGLFDAVGEVVGDALDEALEEELALGLGEAVQIGRSGNMSQPG